MTKVQSQRSKYANVDIDELLQERRLVAVIWSVGDVQEVRPDLTDDQAWQVLKECDRQQDCEAGFTWSHIDTVANNLFGPPYDNN
jgi:hypothetical protein